MKKALLVVLAGLVFVALACGGEEETPAPGALTAAQVQQIVTDALAGAVTQEEVDAATAKAAAEAAAAGLSQADVEAAIAQALAPTPRPLEKLDLGTVTNSVFVLAYKGAIDAGVWEKHGFDVSLDVMPFPAFLASFANREKDISTYAGTTSIRKIANEGFPWVIIGGGLTVMQCVYVPVDSDIETVEDLRGKKLGVWSRASGAVEALSIILRHEFDLDIFDSDQVDLVVAAAPALYALTEAGDVDAQYQLSSLTIRAASEPDKFREVFCPNKFWIERTGQPLAWSAPVVAWRDWVAEDVDRATRAVQAFHETFAWLKDPDNLQSAYEKFGELAAVTNQAQADVYKQWFAEDRIFLTEWDQATIDAQWEFLEWGKEVGHLDIVPPKGVAARALAE